MTVSPLLPLWALALGAVVMLVLVITPAVTARRPAPGATLRRIAVVLLLLLVAVRPAVPEGGESATVTTDVDVFVVVDTTTSMVADDFGDGVRLDGVKADIRAVVAQFTGARFSMIGFDRLALVRVPLTTDANAMLTAVDVLAPELSPFSTGTSISEANDVLQRSLDQARELHPERVSVVVYLGDGEQTREDEPESFEAAGALADGGVVLGYGTSEGGGMSARVSTDPGVPPEQVMDTSVSPATPAVSHLDEANLGAVAAELGVDYLHRVPGEPMAEIPLPERSSGDLIRDSSADAQLELYWIPALLLFAILVWEAALAVLALGATRRRGGVR